MLSNRYRTRCSQTKVGDILHSEAYTESKSEECKELITCPMCNCTCGLSVIIRFGREERGGATPGELHGVIRYSLRSVAFE